MMTNRKQIRLTEKLRAIALTLLAVMAVMLLSSCGLAQGGADGTGPTGEARGFTVYFIDVGRRTARLFCATAALC
jgi:hypothetical protein